MLAWGLRGTVRQKGTDLRSFASCQAGKADAPARIASLIQPLPAAPQLGKPCALAAPVQQIRSATGPPGSDLPPALQRSPLRVCSRDSCPETGRPARKWLMQHQMPWVLRCTEAVLHLLCALGHPLHLILAL
jgi:hypothetical protein